MLQAFFVQMHLAIACKLILKLETGSIPDALFKKDRDYFDKG